MKPKIIVTMEIPIEGKNVTVSDTCAAFEEQIKAFVERLNNDLTNSNIFGKMNKYSVDIKGVKNGRQLELDF